MPDPLNEMKKRRNCERCWLEYKKATPADIHIDDRDLCLACVRAEGLDPNDGEKVVAAIPEAQTESEQSPALEELHAAQPVSVPDKVAPRKQSETGKTDLPSKECEDRDCHNTFTPKQERSRFCSTTCAQRTWYREHHLPAKNPIKLKCKGRNCGNEFVPRSKKHHFCCKACADSVRHPHADLHKPTNVTSVALAGPVGGVEGRGPQTPVRAIPAQPVTPGNLRPDSVSIRVSAKALDRFWQALTLRERAAIVERELEER